jgi:hypothetical protein
VPRLTGLAKFASLVLEVPKSASLNESCGDKTVMISKEFRSASRPAVVIISLDFIRCAISPFRRRLVRRGCCCPTLIAPGQNRREPCEKLCSIGFDLRFGVLADAQHGRFANCGGRETMAVDTGNFRFRRVCVRPIPAKALQNHYSPATHRRTATKTTTIR